MKSELLRKAESGDEIIVETDTGLTMKVIGTSGKLADAEYPSGDSMMSAPHNEHRDPDETVVIAVTYMPNVSRTNPSRFKFPASRIEAKTLPLAP